MTDEWKIDKWYWKFALVWALIQGCIVVVGLTLGLIGLIIAYFIK